MEPCVVALCGLPGSGKSSLARMLAGRTGWQRLDRDELRRLSPSVGYESQDKQLLAQMMLAGMLRSVFANASVILDGMTFSVASDRDAFRERARQAGARWELVWLDCEARLARDRISKDRHHPAADRMPELVDTVAVRFERPRHALHLDARLPVRELADIVLCRLDVETARGKPE